MDNNELKKIELTKVQKMLDWLKTKLFLDSISSNSKNRTVKRGEVYECNFGIGIGSEIQKDRPCVIIQNDIRNLKSGNAIVAPITHTEKMVPCIASIETQYKEDNSILLDGCVNLSLIQTVSKARLGNYITKLSNKDIKNINYSIYDSLGLMSNIKDMEDKILKKDNYIKELKKRRNNLEDELNEIFSLTNTQNYEDLLKFIKKL